MQSANAAEAYSVFVVNDLNDADNVFSDGYFGYAYYGGPFEVMTYDNDGWGISNMDTAHSHETGHIFFALDEYCQPGCYCCDCAESYNNRPNSNCDNSCAKNTACIMKANSSVACSQTRCRVGWSCALEGNEVDDSPYVPYDIASGTTLNPKLCPSNDEDWFRLTPATKGKITITMTPPADKNYDLSLYDSAGTLLQSSSNGTGLQAGTYLVHVHGGMYYWSAYSTCQLNYTFSESPACAQCFVPVCSPP